MEDNQDINIEIDPASGSNIGQPEPNPERVRTAYKWFIIKKTQ